MEGADGKAGSTQADYGFLCASSQVRGSARDKVRHGNAPKVGAEGREREGGGQGGRGGGRKAGQETGALLPQGKNALVYWVPGTQRLVSLFCLRGLSEELSWCCVSTGEEFQGGGMVVGAPGSSPDPNLHLKAQWLRLS